MLHVLSTQTPSKETRSVAWADQLSRPLQLLLLLLPAVRSIY